MRQALPLVLVLVSVAGAQLPTDGRASYSRDDKIVIPFDLPANDKVARVTLCYRFDGGPWHESDSIKPGGKREFLFKADRDGPYGFATRTEFKDGTTDPPRADQLVEQKRVIFDRTPPRIVSVRPATDGSGNPGIEWEVTDENLDPRGVRLEFRWDGQGRFDPIDRNVPFQARDSRHWKLRPRDRMQVKVVATDRAGNRAESDPVWVSGKDATDDPAPVRPTAGGGTGPRDAAVAPAAGTAAPSLHYVNNRKVTLNINATVGPSGLKKAYLYWADEKLVWTKWKEEKGPLPAPDVTSPDKPRMIPVSFLFEAPTDGLFSFIIVVENHKFTSRPVPKNGEAGEVQVMVDTLKPTVEIVGTQVSKNGDRGAAVDIRWRAQDANIAQMPIKLEYQALKDEHAAGGAWKALAPDWINNTGQYTWTAPTGEGHLFKIRVTCKDRAGNENSTVTAEPVNTDLTRPGVDAVDVKPGVSGISVIPMPDK